SRIIAISQSTKRNLCELLRVPDGRVSVVYVGVASEFQPIAEIGAKNDIRRALGIRTDAPTILQVATRGRYKNSPTLIRAVADIVSRPELRDVQVVRIGSDF